MDWYYHDGNEQVGPVSQKVFSRAIHSGKVNGDTHVWHKDLDNWKTLNQVRPQWQSEFVWTENLESSNQKKDTQSRALGLREQCLECGQSFAQSEMVFFNQGYVCAGCKLTYVQKLREGVLAGGALDYGGFWIRFVALVIDGLIMTVAAAALLLPIFLVSFNGDLEETVGSLWTAGQWIFQGVLFFLQIAYDTWFVGKYGATPGKMACGLKIVKEDGSKVSYARALGRHFASMISGAILYIGFIMAAFDTQRRTLHDHICATRVIRK